MSKKCSIRRGAGGEGSRIKDMKSTVQSNMGQKGSPGSTVWLRYGLIHILMVWMLTRVLLDSDDDLTLWGQR